MYRVEKANCIGCGDCAELCPAGAIALVDGRAHIDQEACADCGSCAVACPQSAIVMDLAANLAPTAVRSTISLSTIGAPASALKTSSVVYRPEVEVLPAEPHGSRLWPMVAPLAGTLGSALVWAARELLPAVLRAWQETPGRVEGTTITGRYLAGRAGGAAGQRRNRRRYGTHGAARNRSANGSPNQNRC